MQNRVKIAFATTAFILYCAVIGLIFGNLAVHSSAIYPGYGTETRQSLFDYSYPPYAYYLNPGQSGSMISNIFFSKNEFQERVAASIFVSTEIAG